MRQYLLIVLIGMFAAGCSTIYGRQNDTPNVHFDANVQSVVVDCGGVQTVTPGNMALRQSKTYNCVATKEGYLTEKVRVHSVITKKGFEHSTKVNWEKWSKWTLGLGHLIAWPVDFVSGSMRSHEFDRYILDMKASKETSLAQKAVSKTVSATKTLLTLPGQVVDETATTVLDSTLRSGSEGLGVSSNEKRLEVENRVQGKELIKRYDG